MTAQIIRNELIFGELADEWDALAATAMTDTPFQKLAYQSSWWHNLKPVDASLISVVVRRERGDLAAIAAFYMTHDRTVHFNGCVEETDYLDIICAAQDAKESWEEIFAALHSPDFPEWRYLELCNIPETSPTRVMLPEVCEQYGLTVVESVNEVCPVIALPSSFEVYLEQLDGKQRRELNRKMRRASAAGSVLHMVDESDDLADAVDSFLDLLQKSTFEKRDWLNEGRRALFHETAQAAQRDGTLQLMFLEIEQQRAAALFNFDYADRIWVYNSGLDPDLFSALSPGVVITAQAIEHAIEIGREEFDFLRGDESYKYRFGAEDTTVYRLQVCK
jgi:CelD/BcsL family acetyltransferase involved in cellulose biosynthesis